MIFRVERDKFLENGGKKNVSLADLIIYSTSWMLSSLVDLESTATSESVEKRPRGNPSKWERKPHFIFECTPVSHRQVQSQAPCPPCRLFSTLERSQRWKRASAQIVFVPTVGDDASGASAELNLEDESTAVDARVAPFGVGGSKSTLVKGALMSLPSSPPEASAEEN